MSVIKTTTIEGENLEGLGKLLDRKMRLPHWVSFIIQDTENSKPWLCAINESVESLEKAKELIHRQRIHYRVLSAWVDIHHENGDKKTVFHECYLSQFPKVQNSEYKQVD